jgi:hypothetical protein
VLFVVALFLFNFNTISAQKNVDLEKGLIGYYTFENGANDESGNGNDGELDGVNPEVDINGVDEGSYRWNDDGDFIKIPIDINIGALPKVTMCAWVFVKSYSDPVTVISNDDRGGDRKIYSLKSNNANVWAISDGKGGFIGGQSLQRKHWVFLAATYDEKSKKASLYVDGVKVSGKTQMEMGAGYTYIGANPYENSNEDFEALIDEVRIYDRVLNKAEIDALRALQNIPLFTDVEKVAKPYVYFPKQDNLLVYSGKSSQSQTLGTINMSDSLTGKQVKAKGVDWAEWLEIAFEGKPGFVQLKYLEKLEEGTEPASEFSKSIEKYTDATGWKFWVITVVVLLFSFGASMQFTWVDGVLASITKNEEYEGNLAFFAIFSGLSGVIFAILMVVWQDSIEYYLSQNFSIWPAGYGFAAWAIWVLIIVNVVFFALMVVESLNCGNIIHALARIVIQSILGVLTFTSAMIITIAVIIIVIGLLVVFIAGSALFYRRVYTDGFGNTYVDD